MVCEPALRHLDSYSRHTRNDAPAERPLLHTCPVQPCPAAVPEPIRRWVDAETAVT